MDNPEQIQYKAYIAATKNGEKCSVTIIPPLPTPHLRRAAKLALQAAEPSLGTPRPPFMEGMQSGGVVWHTIAAPGETRFLQANLTPEELERARDVAIASLVAEGLDVIPVGGITITESGLYEVAA